MMATWLIVGGDACAESLRAHLMAADACASIRAETDPWRARELLHGPCAGANVIVGEAPEGPAPVNVAAAMAADGFAGEVMLYATHASGSLRSRAKKAGLARVLTADELAVRPNHLQGAKGALPAAACGRTAEGGSAAPVQSGQGLGAGRAGEKGAGKDKPQMRRNGPGDAPAMSLLDEAAGDYIDSNVMSVGTGAVSRTGHAGTATIERRGGVPVVCFVSGRGGVGKTTVCALSGHIAAGWGMNVAMLDLDLAFGNLAAMCGAGSPPDLAGLSRAQPCASEAIDACGKAVAQRVRVWGPCAAPEYAELVSPLVETIVGRLTQTNDIVLVDTTTNWGDAVACAAQLADRLVIVSDERPGAIPALVRCGALAVRLGVARTRIVRLMNGCDPRGRDMAFVTRAAQGLECARELRVSDGGPEVSELLAAGHAADLAGLDNPLASSMATGLAQLLRELGCLPECEASARALEGGQRPRRLLGGRRREVA